ncbi:MAG: adenosine kinase [Candidatus Puniceispirillales bacterium]
MTDQNPASIVTIGNAIVDIITKADDAFIDAQGMVKSAMNLVDAEASMRLYDAIGPATEISGGSAANTAVGIVSCGGSAGFIGKIARDTLGRIFEHDIRAAGVAFPPVYDDDSVTASSIIVVTPDTERTMNTHLGACITLGPDDMDEAMIAAAEWVYLEGYLFDSPQGPASFDKTAAIARENGTKLAVTMSDSWCVERHHGPLTDFIADHADLIFGNEEEIKALMGTDLEEATAKLPGLVKECVITRGAEASMVVDPSGVISVPVEADVAVVDTTGAGDLFAGGYLFGRQKGLTLEQSARIGALAAAEVISHYGARPETALETLISHHNLGSA